MEYDLNSLTKAELKKLQKDAAKALETLETRKQADAIAALRKTASEHGYSLEALSELVLSSKKGKAKSKTPAKFRNPADPSQTWSGRGRKPQWFKVAESKGTDPEALKV